MGPWQIPQKMTGGYVVCVLPRHLILQETFRNVANPAAVEIPQYALLYLFIDVSSQNVDLECMESSPCFDSAHTWSASYVPLQYPVGH